jgi:hypothetical protein
MPRRFHVINSTSWPHLLFYSINCRGEPVATCTVRATFDIRSDTLERSRTADPIRMSDEYYRAPGNSSLRYAADMAAFKPNADILFVDPVARPPDGHELERPWPIDIRVGALQHRIWACGARRTGLMKPKNKRQTGEVPVIYELAFGGASSVGHWPENPVGVGWHPSSPHDFPQVRASEHDRAKRGPTVGLTPIAATWEPRLAAAGTYDDAWVQDQWPLPPVDFSDDFFNVAPCGLRYPGYLNGTEPVVIQGLSRHSLEFKLPGLERPTLAIWCRRATGDSSGAFVQLQLDTLEINVDRRRVGLVWRACFDVPEAAEHAELLERLPEEMQLVGS